MSPNHRLQLIRRFFGQSGVPIHIIYIVFNSARSLEGGQLSFGVRRPSDFFARANNGSSDTKNPCGRCRVGLDLAIASHEAIFSMDTVRFSLSNVFGGFGEGGGLLHNEGTHLCLEYQVKDGIVGVLKSDIKQLRIPLEDLVSVTLTKGWFDTNWLGVKIVIQCARMDIFQDLPGAGPGRIELSISGKDYEAAEEFVYRLHRNEEVSSGT